MILSYLVVISMNYYSTNLHLCIDFVCEIVLIFKISFNAILFYVDY